MKTTSIVLIASLAALSLTVLTPTGAAAFTVCYGSEIGFPILPNGGPKFLCFCDYIGVQVLSTYGCFGGSLGG
jgi:hypothetical protein